MREHGGRGRYLNRQSFVGVVTCFAQVGVLDGLHALSVAKAMQPLKSRG